MARRQTTLTATVISPTTEHPASGEMYSWDLGSTVTNGEAIGFDAIGSGYFTLTSPFPLADQAFNPRQIQFALKYLF